MGAGHFGQFELISVTEGKPSRPGLRPVGNAPLLVLTHHLSPGGGTFTAAMLCGTYEVTAYLRFILSPE